MGARLVKLLGAAAIVSVGVFPARAEPQCVSWYAKAPIAGTRQGTRCIQTAPVFNFPLSVSDCENFPPVGVTACLEADLHLPLP